MKKNMIHLGIPIIWIGLAIAAIIVYFSQIATRLELPQAIIGLIFFLVTTLDIEIDKNGWHTINAHFTGKKITKKLMLVVGILLIVATISFVEGWPGSAGKSFLSPWHPQFHDEFPKPWTFVVIHSIVNLLGF